MSPSSGLTAAERLLIERIASGVPEDEILRAVRLMAERYGWLYYHIPDSRMTPPGFPDVVLAKGGVVLFVELKAKRTRVRKEQSQWLKEMGAVLEGRRLLKWGTPKTYAGLVTPSNFGDLLHLMKCSTLEVERGEGEDSAVPREEDGE